MNHQETAEAISRTRDVGSYQSELDILLTMLNESAWAMQISFHQSEVGLIVSVMADGNTDYQLDCGSIVPVNLDGFHFTETRGR